MGIWRLDVTSGALDCSEQFLTRRGEREDWRERSTLWKRSCMLRTRRISSLPAPGRDGRQFMELGFRILKPDDGVLDAIRGDGCSKGAAPATFFGVMLDIQSKANRANPAGCPPTKGRIPGSNAHELRNPLAQSQRPHRPAAIDSAIPESERVHAMLGGR